MRLRGPHPRFSREVRAREGRPPPTPPPNISARGNGGLGAHTCAEPEHTKRARTYASPVARVAGAAGAGRVKLGARRGGAASPARSRAATTRRAAPRRPWPGPALALLRATCRRCRLLRAARRSPSARPMGGGRHSGAERRDTTGVSSTGPRCAEPPKSARSSSRPAAARLPALRCRHSRPASPGTEQRAGCPAGGGA